MHLRLIAAPVMSPDEIDQLVDRYLAAGRILGVQYTDLNRVIEKSSLGDARTVEAGLPRFESQNVRYMIGELLPYSFGCGAYELARKANAARKSRDLNYPSPNPDLVVVKDAILAFYARWEPLCLKFLSLKPLVVKGRVPSENPRLVPERTLENTGTCGVCGRNVKMTGMVLFDHGYTKDFGWRNGVCFGAHHQPIEVSNEVLVSYLSYCESRMALLPGLIEKAQANLEVVMRTKGLTRDARVALSQLKEEAQHLPEAIRDTQKAIETWQARPLPVPR